ncbi:hypothetical protein N7520_000184 [Penicillium odoratum]|uniref:uncharacterized protein n=1 Tax=Penicillium odoratum TaxID=1167516 RepID=UPI00254883BE|nr:uncharacterized protein N7520_000184 [Penicillium odoratum]KAJ5776938.1 hypothetical protein N7520_000184 [Penicillium odoratum]
MAYVDRSHYDVYLAVCYPDIDYPEWPVHWIILLHNPGSERCTYFHSATEDGGYRYLQEPDKRFDSWGIETMDFLARIPASEFATVQREALAVPAQSCQCWSSYLIFRLQRLGLVPDGTYEHWRDYHMTSRRLDLGPGGCSCFY